ncbi:MAG TPA: AAA family ATPase [Actinomycetota bacterium]|nr:AAA family ATPase [Actinomycetota bacterium]
MFLRFLRLSGFKSFANPTVLELEPGINVIVGPNGSGKSNIADGISWVLGSQAPSSLRGASMEDVIFAGSAERAGLGVAEVELTLDNGSGTLGLDLSEVTVSRFADRTGSSEYRINSAPCRLLDIQELLSDAGVGRSLHTLVGQGQLDQVLHAQPLERRAFIEEAASIGKYRKRKERSIRKIERVDDNLMRLADVLSELRRALRPLRRQASAAARHSELAAEHRELKQRLCATDLRALELEDAEHNLHMQTRRTALARDELDGVRTRLQSVGAERESAAEGAEQALVRAHGVSRVTDRLESLKRLAAERAARIELRLRAETEEGYRERITLLEAELERWGGRAAERAVEADRARERARERHEQAAAAAAALVETQRAVAEGRARETTAAQAVVRAEGSEAAGRATISSYEARTAAVQQRRNSAQAALEEDVAAIRRARDEVVSSEQRLDEATEAAARAEAALEEQRQEEERLRDALGASGSEGAAADARVEAFEQVEALFADHPELQERLRPLLEEAHTRARLAAAGTEEASAILNQARARSEQRWEEVATLDEQLRNHDALLAAAADRLAAARRRHDKRETELATLDEELARVSEALASAQRAALDERTALPAHRSAQSQAAEDLERLLRSAEDAAEQSRAVMIEANEAEIEARGAEERALSARHRVEEAEAGIADARSSLSGLAEVRDRLERERERVLLLAEMIAEVAARAASWSEQAQGRAREAREQARAAERRVAELRARELELEQGLGASERLRTELDVKRAEARARAEALAQRALEEWGLTAAELGALDVLGEDEVEARSRAQQLESQIRRLGPVNPQAAEECSQAEERERFLVAQMEDLESSKKDLLKIVAEVDETIVQVFSEAFEDVAREFEVVFERLFPGGRGRLELTEGQDFLGGGVEIEARPPGKRVKKLSLLSGGERSLVALAFLFAIFRARPSPFYLLDEVEAALDDINLQRFISLVHELEERAQVLIVTHQKRTMEAADVLYGVTMRADGVSEVIAQRMQESRESPVLSQ